MFWSSCTVLCFPASVYCWNYVNVPTVGPLKFFFLATSDRSWEVKLKDIIPSLNILFHACCFFSLVSAHLCDQRKWEDEIQDLSGGTGLQKERRSHASCSSKPGQFLGCRSLSAATMTSLWSFYLPQQETLGFSCLWCSNTSTFFSNIVTSLFH